MVRLLRGRRTDEGCREVLRGDGEGDGGPGRETLPLEEGEAQH